MSNTVQIARHWTARLLFLPQVSLRAIDGKILILTKKIESSIELAELEFTARAKEGLLFGSVKLGQWKFIGMPKSEVASFLDEAYRGLYYFHLPKVQAFCRHAKPYLANNYARTSKFKSLCSDAARVKGGYQHSPRQNLLSTKIDKQFRFVDDLLADGKKILESSRTSFLKKESARYSDFFDKIESQPLTERQRKACLIDEDSNLVVADPGSGKTSTVVARACYLVESGRAKASEILILAFTKKAAEELQSRINKKLGSAEIAVATFHKLGLDILKETECRARGVSELAADKRKFQKYTSDVLEGLMRKQSYRRVVLEYFMEYWCPEINAFDFATLGDYYKSLNNANMRSLNGDKVKSHGELVIANFLFAHGIDYKYEQKYRKDSQGFYDKGPDYRIYRPDFFLTGHQIYIEYYGIDLAGNTAPCIDAEKYRESMAWKRETHLKNKTACIELFYYEKQRSMLESSLREQLEWYGVAPECLPDEELLNTLRELGRVSDLAKLLCDLVANARTACRTISEVKKLARSGGSAPLIENALKLLVPVLRGYEDRLEAEDEIDFNDMIHRAAESVRAKEFRPRWKYILVDEFQDISKPRADLVLALRENSDDCSIFCVGDDCQSIYRFSGGDIDYFTNHSRYFETHSTTMLDKSFRLNSSIAEISSKFISRNPGQLQRQAIAANTADRPAVSVLRTRSINRLSEIRRVLEKIAASSRKSPLVYVLGRYNHSLDKDDQDKFIELRNELKKQSIVLEYHTAHSSKGKEADYVIVIGLASGTYGFPSEIPTNPLLELFLPPKESFAFAEERRLFYVALTRAKEKVYLIADMTRASSFLVELLKDGEYDIDVSEFKAPAEQVYATLLRCPGCETGTLVRKAGHEENGGRFAGCSNYPRCDYTEKLCEYRGCDGICYRKNGLRICCACDHKSPLCTRCGGVVVLRQNAKTGDQFAGCSNYPVCENTEPLCSDNGCDGMCYRKDGLSICCACERNTPLCPQCGGVLRRYSRRTDGSQFAGCSNFPSSSCRYTDRLCARNNCGGFLYHKKDVTTCLDCGHQTGPSVRTRPKLLASPEARYEALSRAIRRR